MTRVFVFASVSVLTLSPILRNYETNSTANAPNWCGLTCLVPFRGRRGDLLAFGLLPPAQTWPFVIREKFSPLDARLRSPRRPRCWKAKIIGKTAQKRINRKVPNIVSNRCANSGRSPPMPPPPTTKKSLTIVSADRSETASSLWRQKFANAAPQEPQHVDRPLDGLGLRSGWFMDDPQFGP